MVSNPSKKSQIKTLGNRFRTTFSVATNFILQENIFISLGSIFFFLSGYHLLTGDYPNIIYISLIFWSTLLIYQINTKIKFNFLDFSTYKTYKSSYILRLKFVALLLIILLFHLPFLQITGIIFLIHLALISTLYNVPENSKRWIRLPLRSIPILKVFLIAYVWASVSTWLPAIIEGFPVLAQGNSRVFIAHFFFIMAITLPFDIRDHKTDQVGGLITFPQVIGMIQTKILALVCLGIFIALMKTYIWGWYFFIFNVLTAGLIILSSRRRKDYYFTFFIDGTLILYFLILFLTGK